MTDEEQGLPTSTFS